MKLKKTFKRIIFWGAFITFLNYYSLPIGGCVGAKLLRKEAYNKKIQQVCKIDEHLESVGIFSRTTS